MQEPVTYSIDHSTASAELALTDERLIVRTKGKGMIDKPQIIDIPLTQLKYFCLVPTTAPQNLVSSGTGGGDFSYDSELIFSYQAGAQLKKKRLFVDSRNESFERLLKKLERSRPDASLLNLEPAEAQKQIGVVSASKVIYVLIGLLVGIPILIALVVIILKVLSGGR
jgi:hypothetical protein